MECAIHTLVTPVFRRLGAHYEEINGTVSFFVTTEDFTLPGFVASFGQPEKLFIQIKKIMTLDPANDNLQLKDQLNSIPPGGFCVYGRDHLALGAVIGTTEETEPSDFADCFRALLARLTAWYPVLMRIRYSGMSCEDAWQWEPLTPDPSRCDPRVARLIREALKKGV